MNFLNKYIIRQKNNKTLYLTVNSNEVWSTPPEIIVSCFLFTVLDLNFFNYSFKEEYIFLQNEKFINFENLKFLEKNKNLLKIDIKHSHHQEHASLFETKEIAELFLDRFSLSKNDLEIIETKETHQLMYSIEKDLTIREITFPKNCFNDYIYQDKMLNLKILKNNNKFIYKDYNSAKNQLINKCSLFLKDNEDILEKAIYVVENIQDTDLNLLDPEIQSYLKNRNLKKLDLL